MPTPIETLNSELEETDRALALLGKANYGNVLGAMKWSIYAKRRSLRMRLAKLRGDHTDSEFKAAFPELKCCICGSSKKPSKDHIVPVSKGGSNALSNIRILCVRCNARKGSKNAN